MSKMKKTVPVEAEDFNEIERCAYEVTTAKRLIEFFVTLAKEKDAADMLAEYIATYQKDLALATTHQEALVNKVMEMYFPYEDGYEKQKTSFYMDFERKEITYTYDGEETA